MEEEFQCSICEEVKNEKEFKTDIDGGQIEENFVCEQCYDEMND